MTEEIAESKFAALDQQLAELASRLAELTPKVNQAEAKVQMLEINQGAGGAGAGVSPVFGEALIPQIGGDDSDGCYELTISKSGSSYSGTFANQYYRVAGKTYTTSFSSATITNGILCLEVDATGSQPSASMATYSDVAALQNAEQDLSKFVCPLYTISNYAIACDWRKGAIIAMTEF